VAGDAQLLRLALRGGAEEHPLHASGHDAATALAHGSTISAGCPARQAEASAGQGTRTSS
jgi:hypothetical protein